MLNERKYNVYIARKEERMALYGITEITMFQGTDNERTYFVCPYCRAGWETLMNAQSCVMGCEQERGVYVKGRRTNSKKVAESIAV